MQVGAAFLRGGAAGTGGTITSVIPQWAQARLAYRLFDSPKVTHAGVVSGHCARTLQATEAAGDYLLIEDTTTLAYHGRPAAAGLGPIGDAYTQGLWMHSTLAVRADWEREDFTLLGLLGQKVWTRPPGGYGTGRHKKKRLASKGAAGLESARWAQTLVDAGGPLDDTTWTYVADRESDIHEVFQSAWADGWHLVIRACQPRALAGDQEGQTLFAAARQAPRRGTITLRLPGADRTATLEVHSTAVTVRGPQRRGIAGGWLEDHRLNVVWVHEPAPPAGVEAVEWILLTDLPVSTLDECLRVVEIYQHRWLIEEFHKCLKTGLKAESSQLSDARRLGALLGVLSVAAVYLLQMKLACRGAQGQEELAAHEVDPVWTKILRRLDPPPHGRATRAWFWVGVAKLGGHLARKHDGPPGWLTMWRGWQTLLMLARGFALANTS